MKREIWKGSEAISEAAIRCGCRGFFGYPITPQNEIPEYMSYRMPQAGGVFVQAESELAAINMVYGAAASGIRVMTSSSSPGISLKQEGISYMAGAQLPAVIVNVMRGSPGLGSIQPAQGDYYQATRGGGNGDYRTVTLAPATLQDAVELIQDAFDIADRYRNPVMVLVDGLIAQMMEPVVWKERETDETFDKSWTASGRKGRSRNNFITSLFIDASICENHNELLRKKYTAMEERECRWKEIMTEDAEIILVAYGTPSRIAETAVGVLREQGIKAGLLRPVSLWPFPSPRLKELASQSHVKAFLDVEMSMGQMLDDVRLAVAERKPVMFYGRTGGMIPSVSEVVKAACEAYEEVK